MDNYSFNITYRCNIKCRFCSALCDQPIPTKVEMSMDQFTRALTMIKEQYGKGFQRPTGQTAGGEEETLIVTAHLPWAIQSNKRRGASPGWPAFAGDDNRNADTNNQTRLPFLREAPKGGGGGNAVSAEPTQVAGGGGLQESGRYRTTPLVSDLMGLQVQVGAI